MSFWFLRSWYNLGGDPEGPLGPRVPGLWLGQVIASWLGMDLYTMFDPLRRLSVNMFSTRGVL